MKKNTVKICLPHESGDWANISAEDFDPRVHTLYVESENVELPVVLVHERRVVIDEPTTAEATTANADPVETSPTTRPSRRR